jgi:SOS-response transcriptional repressor LexA
MLRILIEAAESGRVVLKPENKAYPVVRPKGELEIFGVRVSCFGSTDNNLSRNDS